MSNLSFIDSHCHLHLPWFTNEVINQIIENAKLNNITHIMNCGSKPNTFDQVIASSQHQEISIHLGLDPPLAKNLSNADSIREKLDQGHTIGAIGEVGLDYYWVKEEKDRLKQEILFIDCINLASEYDLPLVIHTRKAETRSLEILEKYSQTPVLLHSFEGNLKEVMKAIDLGYLISIPTNVVIRKSRRKVAKRAGLDNIVLETDSPFCAPFENYDQHNTPTNIPIAAKKLAEILEVSIEAIASRTTKNAKNFFKLA